MHRILIIFLFLPLSLSGQKLVIEDPAFDKADMEGHVSYLEDPEADIPLTDILNGKYDQQFTTDKSLIDEKLVSESRYWLKTEIMNRTGKIQDYFMLLEDPSIYSVKAYYFNEDHELVTQNSGIELKPSERRFNGHQICFLVQVPEDSTVKVYISAEARNFLTLPFKLYSRDSYTNKILRDRMFLGIFYGILLAIILYNLFHYFSTRQSYFLYYVLYSFFFGLITGTYDGLTPEFFHFYVRWTAGYHDIFSIGLANIFFMAFMLSFLGIRTIAPKFGIFVYIYILVTMVIFLMTIWTPGLALILAAFLSFPTAFIVIIGGLMARKSRLFEANFFIVGYIVFFIFIFIALLTILKVLPTNFFTFHALHFGYFSNLLILSAGLGYKLNFGMKERQKLIEVKNRELEEKVQERTREISDRNKELIKLNTEMDRFVYSTSHDLKAPLSSLLGLINVIQVEKEPEQISKYFGMMEKTIRKLSDFINEIVDYSRNARMEIEPEEVDMNALIKEVFESLEFTEESKVVSQQIKVNKNGKFYSDPNRLKVILNNLISNALRFAGVGIEEKEVLVSVDIDQNQAEIIVKDTGPGIKPEHMDKIFDMFYRASPTKSGSGLGLYIVMETINKLEGEITVESEVNKGTCFTFRIPNLIPN